MGGRSLGRTAAVDDLPRERAAFILYGEPCSKANSRRLLRAPRTGKLFSAKSAKACATMASYVAQLKSRWRGRAPLEGPLKLTATLYYASRRPDLDDSLVADALQRAGVIVNDRQIEAKALCKQIDPERPRVECVIERIEGGR